MRSTPPAWAPRGWAPRNPFLVASLVLHAVLLIALYATTPPRVRRVANPANPALEQALRQRQAQDVSAALAQARRRQMQRHLQSLERMARELEAAAKPAPDIPPLPAADGASSPAAMLTRAQALAERLAQHDQALRAREMAKLLKITPEAALAKVKAEDLNKLRDQPRPLQAPEHPEQALARLERQAREAAERRQERERQQTQGHPVAMATAQEGTSARGSGAAGFDRSGDPSSGQESGRESGGGGGGGHAIRSGGDNSIGGVGEPGRRFAAGEMPAAIPAGTLRLASGRVIGPGGTLSNRIYLDRWYVVGPFPGPSSRALNTVYPPEVAVDLDAVYLGRDGELIGWQPQHSPQYPFVPEPRAPDAVFYAYTELRVDRDMSLWLDIGADDDAKLWLNDRLVWVGGNGDKPWYHRPFHQMDAEIARYQLVEGSRQVNLHGGRNTLLFKLYNGIDLMFLSVVVRP